MILQTNFFFSPCSFCFFSFLQSLLEEAKNQPNSTYPCYIDPSWDENYKCVDLRDAAEKLGYNQTTWNENSASIGNTAS